MKKNKKLELTREVLRSLSNDELGAVAGGTSQPQPPSAAVGNLAYSRTCAAYPTDPVPWKPPISISISG